MESMMAPSLLALHPGGRYMVLAVGASFRIFDLCENSHVMVKDETEPSFHGDAIKSIAFDIKGGLFVSAGDDKLVKLWNTETWNCTKTIRTSKKVSAATLSHDSEWLFFADKFGVVYAISTRPAKEQTNCLEQPVQLLAHCCSIITDLACSYGGKYLVSADRDFKIRVTLVPQNPLNGAHEIESFCLGHTSFVSCIAFIGSDIESTLLISGGGDATVRLWNCKTGRLLDTFHVAKQVDLNGQNKVESDSSLAVTGICVSSDRTRVAVTVESFSGVLFLSCDHKAKKLVYLQEVVFPEKFSPTSIGFDRDGRLWLVSGATEQIEFDGPSLTPDIVTKAQSLAAETVTCVKSISLTSSRDNPFDSAYVIDEHMPGGELLLRALEGSQPDPSKAVLAAEAAKEAFKRQLLKQQYSEEHRDQRKQTRNDRKLQRKS